MSLSFLQLKHYHFTGISILARPGVNPDKAVVDAESYPVFGKNELATHVSLGEVQGDADPHDFAVLLAINCDPSEKSHFPYSFVISLEGVFSIKHDGDLNERKRLVMCNGASMLYGSAREMLLSLTARQKNGPMLLPSVNFHNILPSQIEENAASDNSIEMKKKRKK